MARSNCATATTKACGQDLPGSSVAGCCLPVRPAIPTSICLPSVNRVTARSGIPGGAWFAGQAAVRVRYSEPVLPGGTCTCLPVDRQGPRPGGQGRGAWFYYCSGTVLGLARGEPLLEDWQSTGSDDLRGKRVRTDLRTAHRPGKYLNPDLWRRLRGVVQPAGAVLLRLRLSDRGSRWRVVRAMNSRWTCFTNTNTTDAWAISG